MKCIACENDSAARVIACGMPMKFCFYEECATLWGEPFASIYSWVFAPCEGMVNGGFVFIPYNDGHYFRALWHWLVGGGS